jgi:hypothetical protein
LKTLPNVSVSTSVPAMNATPSVTAVAKPELPGQQPAHDDLDGGSLPNLHRSDPFGRPCIPSTIRPSAGNTIRSA